MMATALKLLKRALFGAATALLAASAHAATPTVSPPTMSARTATVDAGATESALDLQAPLTPDDAVRIGLQRNPQVSAAEAAVAGAAATYRSTASFPSVNLGLTHVRGSSAAPTLNGDTRDTFFDLNDTVDTSGQRRFLSASQRAQWNSSVYQLQELRLTIAQQIRDAYWALVAARAQTQIANESLLEVSRVYDLVNLQLAAGSSPRSDVLRSSVDVANSRQAYISAQGSEKAALSGLNVLLARPPLAPIVLAANLAETSAPPSVFPKLLPLPSLTEKALSNRPLVRSARQLVRASDYSLKQAKAARYPDLSVDFERSLQQPIQTVVLGVRAPLLDFGAVRETIKAAEENRKQSQFQLRLAEQQVAQQVSQAYADLIQAQTLAQSYAQDIVAPSTTLLAMTKLGYGQGATGILPVIDAENTLRNARTGYINSLQALRKAEDEILAAVGGNPE